MSFTKLRYFFFYSYIAQSFIKRNVGFIECFQYIFINDDFLKTYPCGKLHYITILFGILDYLFNLLLDSVQFSSATQSCPTLCDLMNCSTLGLPVHHQLLESTQIHVHCAGDAIQPSYPLLSPSPPALSLSQHQGLFQ